MTDIIAALFLAILVGSVLAMVAWACRAAGLGSHDEVAEAPDGVDVSPGMRRAHKVLVDVRADRVDVNRRLALIAKSNPDLAALPRQLEDLYLIEVER